jgi:hypothetical protein
MRPLSKDQIRALIGYARAAYEMECSGFSVQGSAVEEKDCLSFDEWRHHTCLVVVERSGFTQCVNDDYLPLKSHFLRLAGREGEADAALLRHETEPRSNAMAKLRDECLKAADVLPYALDYAAGFLRRAKIAPSLDEANEKQLWRCVFKVRQKAAKVRKERRLDVRAGEEAAGIKQLPNAE